MAYKLLNDESLKNFIKITGLSQEIKESLISEVPSLDLMDRISLFETLAKVYSLDLMEKKEIERIQTGLQ